MNEIILKIDNIDSEILGSLSETHLKGVERKLSFRPEGYAFSPAFNTWFFDKNDQRTRRKWDGWKRQFWSNKKRTYFPTGLISLVAEYCIENQIKYKILDQRIKPFPNLNLTFDEKFKFREYQNNIINIACERTRGIIRAATGSGKTAIGAGIIAKIGVSPALFLVTSIDLLEQAKDSFEEILTSENSKLKVGQIGGGVIDIKDVNICTIQTLVRAIGGKWDSNTKFDSDDTDDDTKIDKHKEDIKELLRTAKLSISDEIQRWRAETCQIVNKELKSAYYNYGVSATPYRDEGDDMLIQACFGKVISSITASELIRQGFLVRPKIKFIHIKGQKSKFKQWQSIYKEQVTENEYYNNIVANIANAYIKQDRTVLTLIQKIPHGKLLSHLTDSQLVYGKDSKNIRKEALDKLRQKKIKSICASQIFDEGIDVRVLDTVILAGQGKSKVRAMQRIGRICRPYTSPEGKVKTEATAIDPVIHQKYLLDHAKEREKMYRSEPEYDIEHIEL